MATLPSHNPPVNPRGTSAVRIDPIGPPALSAGLGRVTEPTKANRAVDAQYHECENEERDDCASCRAHLVVGDDGPLPNKPDDESEEGNSQVQPGPPSVVHTSVEIDLICRLPESYPLRPRDHRRRDYSGFEASASWNSISRHDGQSRAGNSGDCCHRMSGRGAKRVSEGKSPGSEPGLNGSQRIDAAVPNPASPRMNPCSIGPPHFRHDSFSERSAITPTGEISVLYHSPLCPFRRVPCPERSASGRNRFGVVSSGDGTRRGIPSTPPEVVDQAGPGFPRGRKGLPCP